MASTRNKNLTNNYCYEKRYLQHQSDFNLYTHSSGGRPYHQPMIPSGGMVPPSKMSRDDWTNNSIDIETALRGIGANNLVNPAKSSVYYKPNYKTPPQLLAFFERTPVIIPEPLICPLNQRALPTT